MCALAPSLDSGSLALFRPTHAFWNHRGTKAPNIRACCGAPLEVGSETVLHYGWFTKRCSERAPRNPDDIAHAKSIFQAIQIVHGRLLTRKQCMYVNTKSSEALWEPSSLLFTLQGFSLPSLDPLWRWRQQSICAFVMYLTQYSMDEVPESPVNSFTWARNAEGVTLSSNCLVFLLIIMVICSVTRTVRYGWSPRITCQDFTWACNGKGVTSSFNCLVFLLSIMVIRSVTRCVTTINFLAHLFKSEVTIDSGSRSIDDSTLCFDNHHQQSVLSFIFCLINHVWLRKLKCHRGIFTLRP